MCERDVTVTQGSARLHFARIQFGIVDPAAQTVHFFSGTHQSLAQPRYGAIAAGYFQQIVAEGGADDGADGAGPRDWTT